jgi:hypothetical protein
VFLLRLHHATGILGVALLSLVFHRLVWRVPLTAQLHARAVGLPGLAAGVLLDLSQTASTLAGGADKGLGYFLSKTISRSSVLVSGAWGVVLYGEIRSLLQVLFWMAGVQMLLSDVVMLIAKATTC